MVDLAKKIVKDRQVDELNGSPLEINPDNCIRIAVLHHHPVADPKTADEQEKFKYMENNEYFVENCFKAGIQLVLFGHQHWRYQVKLDHAPYLKREFDKLPIGPRVSSAPKSPFGEWQDLYFVCAPSTLEYSAKNGFYLYRFGQSVSSKVSRGSSSGPEAGKKPASHVDIDCFEWDDGKVAFSRQPSGKIEFI
jgi:hypothetical protein